MTNEAAERLRRSEVPQHTAIYADLDSIIRSAERAINLLHDAEVRAEAAHPATEGLDVERLGRAFGQANLAIVDLNGRWTPMHEGLPLVAVEYSRLSSPDDHD